MKYLVYLALALFIPWAHADLNQSNHLYKVQRVVDGDTVILENLGRVRLIGVDTPETKDPRKPVQYFGKEASQFLTDLLSNRHVRVEYDQNKIDKFKRTLAYLYLEDGTFINAEIIKQGYGHAYTRFPFRHLEDFRKYEKQARKARVGLWADKDLTSKNSIANKSYSCKARKKCSQIKSCEEAMYLLNQCNFQHLDSNKDGIPCEKLCR